MSQPNKKRAGTKMDPQERLMRCMGKHMKAIALISLPDNLDIASQGSSATRGSKISAADAGEESNEGIFRRIQREATAALSIRGAIETWRSGTLTNGDALDPETAPEQPIDIYWPDNEEPSKYVEDVMVTAMSASEVQDKEGTTFPSVRDAGLSDRAQHIMGPTDESETQYDGYKSDESTRSMSLPNRSEKQVEGPQARARSGSGTGRERLVRNQVSTYRLPETLLEEYLRQLDLNWSGIQVCS